MKHINNKFYNYKNGMQEINHIKNVGKKGDVYIFTNFEGKGGGNFTVTIKESKYSGWVIYVDENKTRKTNINIKFENDYEQYTKDLKYIERKNKKLEKEYEKKMLENAEELSKQQVELDAVALEKQKLIDEMNELKGVKTEKTNSPK